MNPNQASREEGDFTRIAESVRESGEAVVLDLGVIDGLRVLDLRLRRRYDGATGGAAWHSIDRLQVDLRLAAGSRCAAGMNRLSAS
jgi:hypothetical protein